ncbi:GNAT family N-acetyltransferase [Streptomyces sp. NPDC059009]|uniref:GNAT family N-acetyltransferase n=1 Tax=Streptomyces sp. NPDC059009 TaxID=3346694 RepID=UPI0036AEB207
MNSQTAVDVRHITNEDLPQWVRAWSTGYLHQVDEDAVSVLRHALARDQVIGAFDKDRCVGTYRSSAQELTVPGGAHLPVAAVSKVSVAGTHRRRGLLSRMLDMDLRDAVARQVPAVVLDAAQYPIYGRFGFGPATTMAWYEIDVHRAALDRRHTADLDGVEIVDAAEYFKRAPDVYERFRATQPGALRRPEDWWRDATDRREHQGTAQAEPFYALYTDPGTGRTDGLLCFTAEETWGSMLPQTPLRTTDFVTLTSAAERALLRYAVTVDWASTVHLPYRAPDTLAPLWLGDPRAARLTALSDYMWLRILDVAHTLSARTYPAEGTLVLEVDDPAGHAQGRWLLDGGPDSSSCAPTTRRPDIRLTVQALGSLYLGDESASRLASLGQVEELRTGALCRTDVMFRTGRRPWSPRAALMTRPGQAGPGH